MRGPADRTLVYLLLYVGDCLGLLRPGMSLSEAQRAISNSSSRQFTIPGEAGFPLNGMFQPPNRGEAEQLRSYLSAVRAETAARLLSRVYAQDGQSPSKWWLAFYKRKFMNKSLSSN
jgi:actin related protein 2/3 complex subunit 3